ncbi:hypothetical protein EU546_02470 [Candidatus Thorarchaeota archaeon]|nr:MAG: hypothetical protein EU546_02470 [Candidatus Thorarchaeota archaeon]
MHGVDMREVWLKGSYSEMGRQFGETLSEWHRTFVPSKELLSFARECEKSAKQYASDILDELRGIAKSTGASYESLISTSLAPTFAFGCTLLAVDGRHTSHGSPLFARQQDWIKSDIDSLHVIHAEPADRYRTVGFSFGDCGRYGGQNEKGLTIGSAYVGMYTGKIRPGIRMSISSRWALDNFASTEETVEYLMRIPHTEPVAFLIADQQGAIARVETCPEKTSVSYADDGTCVVSNCFVHEDMRHLDKGWPEGNIVYRLIDATSKWIEEKSSGISFDGIKSLCSDNQNGICVFSEDSEDATRWS